ncbi:MAG: hypothetical protein LBE84_08525 [Planctomycetota bacterium]|jgi:hypothetical protein|nr:hypothetical protein [Planctomycetota bacterium]
MIGTSRSCFLALLALSLGVVGCGNNNVRTTRAGLIGSKKKRSFSFLNRKSEKREAVRERNGGGRELAELQEQERIQAKMVAEMREALSQGEDIVTREEAKLQNIRTQLATTDAGSNSGGFRNRIYQGDDGREFSNYEERIGDERREYIQPGRDVFLQGTNNRNRSGGKMDNKTAFPPESNNDGRGSPMMAPSARRSRQEYYPAAEPYEIHPRQTTVPPAFRSGGMDEEEIWSLNGNLYQETGEMVPPLPNRRQPSDIQYNATHETQNRPVEPMASRLPEKRDDRSLVPDRRPVSAPMLPQTSPGGNSPEDDVFVPDLFLNSSN